MRLCTIASGSSGNCTLLSQGDCHILIDAGISMKRVSAALAGLGLALTDVSAILVTHEHHDHIAGLPMLCKHYRLPIFAPRTLAQHLRERVPGAVDCLHTVEPDRPFALGVFTVTAFPTPHDAAESVGYRVAGECTFALATDMGHVSDAVARGLQGADAVLIEANHDPDMLLHGPYPYPLKQRILSPRGHLSNGDCGHLARWLWEQGTRTVVLGHLSRENNSPAAALAAVSGALGARELRLCVAPAGEVMALELERSIPCCL